jgi:hypothetical protein
MEVSQMWQKLVEIFEEESDQRTTQWFLMGSPFPVAIVSVIYLLLVTVILPKFMENRKAFSIKRILLLYNVWQVVINLIFFALTVNYTWIGGGYSWR